MTTNIILDRHDRDGKNVKVNKRLGRKRDKYLPESLPLSLPPCRVCGKKASGIHYGVNTCEACKGFFRRFLKRKEPYSCVKGWMCELTSKRKGHYCSACRMQKCLDLGMSKEGVRQGRYTLIERTKRILELKKEQTCQKTEMTENSDLDKYNSHKCVNMDPISKILSDSDSGRCSNKALLSELNVMTCSMEYYLDDKQLTGSDSPHSSPVGSSRSSLCSSGLLTPPLLTNNSNPSNECAYTASEIQEMESFIDVIVKAYGQLQHFTQTKSDEEIKELIQSGYQKHLEKIKLFGKMDPIPSDEYNEIYKNTKLDVDSRTQNSTQRRTEFAASMAEFVCFANDIPGFYDLPQKDRSNLVKASRLDFFLILEYRAKDPLTEMMVSYSGRVVHMNDACAYLPKQMLKSWWDISHDIRLLNPSKQEHAVILALSFISTGRCQLQSPDLVHKIETKLVKHLLFLLHVRYKEDSRRHFTKIIDLFIKLRSLSQDYHALYKKLCEDKILMSRAPEMVAMLFDE